MANSPACMSVRWSWIANMPCSWGLCHPSIRHAPLHPCGYGAGSKASCQADVLGSCTQTDHWMCSWRMEYHLGPIAAFALHFGVRALVFSTMHGALLSDFVYRRGARAAAIASPALGGPGKHVINLSLDAAANREVPGEGPQRPQDGPVQHALSAPCTSKINNHDRHSHFCARMILGP
jgi:hypothetical protein